MAQNTKRFGYFATLPLPDVDASLSEIKRAYDELGVDGVTLHSNYDGIYLSDPRFELVWEELERRSATVFLHPTRPPMPVLPGAPSPLADYPADTTRSALDLILKGHRKKFSSTKVILSHGGGYLAYAATRFAELSASLSNDRDAEDFMNDIRSFYYDTALVATSGLPSLLSTIPSEHLVFGTDYPYASEKVCKVFTANLDKSAAVGAGVLQGINTNAARLIPRLRQAAEG